MRKLCVHPEWKRIISSQYMVLFTCRGDFTLLDFPQHEEISNAELLEIVEQWNSFFSAEARGIAQIQLQQCEYKWEDVVIPEGWLEMFFSIDYSGTSLRGRLQVTITTWSKTTLFEHEIVFSKQNSLKLPHPRELLQHFPEEFWVDGIFSDSFVKIVRPPSSNRKPTRPQPAAHFCAICLETTPHWIRLECQHKFHAHCLHLNSNLDFSDGSDLIVTGACPLCRQPYKLLF